MEFVLSAILVCLIVVGVGCFRSPNVAIGIGACLSFAFPQWLPAPILTSEFRLPIAVGLFCLGYYCFHPGSHFRTALNRLDYILLVFVIIGVVADFWNDGVRLWVVVYAYAEWCVPFLLGRLSFCLGRDLRLLVLVTTGVGLLVSIGAIVESMMEINAFELFFGERPSDLPKYLPRFGWQRAFGPTENPIFLGTLLVVLFPWTCFYVFGSLQTGKNWPLMAIGIHLLGIVATISRAPILAVCLFPVVAGYVMWRRLRLSIAVSACILLLVAIFNWSSLKQELIELGGENVARNGTPIIVDGEKVSYSNVDHRFLLWKVYRKAIQEAGLLGYGTDRTSTFPPNVPMDGNSDLKALQSLWCIDNHYLLLILRFGYLGVIAWFVLVVVTAVEFARLSQRSTDLSMLFILASGMVVAVAFIQMTVWMPIDYGYAFIWMIGMASGALAANKAGIEL